MSFGKFRSDDPQETNWQSADQDEEVDKKWSRGDFISGSGINKQRSVENRTRLMNNRFEQNRGYNLGQQRRNKANEFKSYQSRFNNDQNQNYHQHDQTMEFQGRSFGNRGQRRSPDRNRGRGWGRGRGGGGGRGRGRSLNNYSQRNSNNRNSGKRWVEKKKPTEKELDKELEKYYTGGGNDGKERTEQMLDDELKDYYKIQQDKENVATDPTQNDKDTDAHVITNTNTNTNTNTDQQDKR